jgi:hypothetical protein
MLQYVFTNNLLMQQRRRLAYCFDRLRHERSTADGSKPYAEKEHISEA